MSSYPEEPWREAEERDFWNSEEGKRIAEEYERKEMDNQQKINSRRKRGGGDLSSNSGGGDGYYVARTGFSPGAILGCLITATTSVATSSSNSAAVFKKLSAAADNKRGGGGVGVWWDSHYFKQLKEGKLHPAPPESKILAEWGESGGVGLEKYTYIDLMRYGGKNGCLYSVAFSRNVTPVNRFLEPTGIQLDEVKDEHAVYCACILRAAWQWDPRCKPCVFVDDGVAAVGGCGGSDESSEEEFGAIVDDSFGVIKSMQNGGGESKIQRRRGEKTSAAASFLKSFVLYGKKRVAYVGSSEHDFDYPSGFPKEKMNVVQIRCIPVAPPPLQGNGSVSDGGGASSKRAKISDGGGESSSAAALNFDLDITLVAPTARMIAEHSKCKTDVERRSWLFGEYSNSINILDGDYVYDPDEKRFYLEKAIVPNIDVLNRMDVIDEVNGLTIGDGYVIQQSAHYARFKMDEKGGSVEAVAAVAAAKGIDFGAGKDKIGVTLDFRPGGNCGGVDGFLCFVSASRKGVADPRPFPVYIAWLVPGGGGGVY